ncbi:hypothetical protein PENANT_c046G07805 [Penicillium antarcticum]|uniref:Uncharacterized protein n=1 Tax=Penicillium antarcticum TaxID=416450 RepID=A0A1V6PRJ9_9EURO|nr:uncharacterized protein N7508_006792 [Penicillium antarcticum]KAJ5301929.1 hypothetical protein N7508_006792 [Penicillium antarcticum]OQD79649.1 hypothetical protein PENANT_c046G07805 [Penicillium antarcticum]
MAFWVDWQLWEKLSMVLAILIALVLVYAFGVLAYNRWIIRKHAAAEAQAREEEAELYPMLHSDGILFGARALESGIAIEGIWVSNPNTPVQSPCQPGTPVGSRPVSPALKILPKASETPKSSLGSGCALISPTPVAPAGRRAVLSQLDLASASFVYETKQHALSSRASLPINPNAFCLSPAQEEKLVSGQGITRSQRRASFHTRLFSSSRHFEAKDLSMGSDGTDVTHHAPTENKRASRFTKTLRRRSSEEFRRKMSRIFNENIQLGVPAEQLEFNPALREYQKRDFRKSLLRPFRPWMNSAENEAQ